MRKRYLTNKRMFLINMLLFIGMSFEFIIRNDVFFGGVLIFTGILNLFAFQQAPKRVGKITVLLNFFNALIALTIAYNYIEINYTVLLMVWSTLSIVFLFSTLRQIYSIYSNLSYRKKQKRKIS